MIISLQLYLNTKIGYFGRQLINVHTQKMTVYEKGKKYKAWLILEPNSLFRNLWTLMIFLQVLYTLTITPLRFSFFPVSDLLTKGPNFYIELMIDICFSLDLFLNFITAFEKVNGEFEYRAK